MFGNLSDIDLIHDAMSVAYPRRRSSPETAMFPNRNLLMSSSGWRLSLNQKTFIEAEVEALDLDRPHHTISQPQLPFCTVNALANAINARIPRPTQSCLRKDAEVDTLFEKHCEPTCGSELLDAQGFVPEMEIEGLDTIADSTTPKYLMHGALSNMRFRGVFAIEDTLAPGIAPSHESFQTLVKPRALYPLVQPGSSHHSDRDQTPNVGCREGVNPLDMAYHQNHTDAQICQIQPSFLLETNICSHGSVVQEQSTPSRNNSDAPRLRASTPAPKTRYYSPVLTPTPSHDTFNPSPTGKRPDTPRPPCFAVCQSVERETGPHNFLRKSTPAYEDRSHTPSPVSRTGTSIYGDLAADTEMVDAPSASSCTTSDFWLNITRSASAQSSPVFVAQSPQTNPTQPRPTPGKLNPDSPYRTTIPKRIPPPPPPPPPAPGEYLDSLAIKQAKRGRRVKSGVRDPGAKPGRRRAVTGGAECAVVLGRSKAKRSTTVTISRVARSKARTVEEMVGSCVLGDTPDRAGKDVVGEDGDGDGGETQSVGATAGGRRRRRSTRLMARK